MKDYKSDDNRLAWLFKRARDNWKKRSNEKQKQIRFRDNKIRDLIQSRDNWKDKSNKYKEDADNYRKELEALKKKQMIPETGIGKIAGTNCGKSLFSVAYCTS